ncbi:hypothetical protein QQF64_023102 [Cirrhinus molitorella]|uniref:Uncharacterized protein n=2 Tax=Cirrhinus molitorella TaxID=172907 RepID=A0ABR3L6I9_9TELE|nr:hypothetical protein Q8A67_025535 [Cirrhinus molitorella]
MLLIIEALLLISAALEQDHRAAAEGLIYPFNMALNSVDDQYDGCTEEMAHLVMTEYLQKELNNSAEFQMAWQEAKSNASAPEDDLTENHSIAIYVYTDKDVYREFNKAVRSAEVANYSTFPDEDEVLIPPYETFKVTDVRNRTDENDLWCDTVFTLESSGKISDLNYVLVGILNEKMFGSGTKKWFSKKNKRQRTKGGKPVNRKRKKWVAKVLKQHREMILKELDVNKVLPYLVYDKVFSLGEYKEILGQDSNKKRTELFLDQLSQKGPCAFNAFCSVLEEVCPHLLTCFLLDCEDGSAGGNKKQGQTKPAHSQENALSKGQDTVCFPPMYTDPLFDTSELMCEGPPSFLPHFSSLFCLRKVINHTAPAGEGSCGSGPALTPWGASFESYNPFLDPHFSVCGKPKKEGTPNLSYFMDAAATLGLGKKGP